jgi:hypothetical protein
MIARVSLRALSGIVLTCLVDVTAAVRQNQSGVAVYRNGTWKVGVASCSGLLVLENNGSTASLPAACRAAS